MCGGCPHTLLTIALTEINPATNAIVPTLVRVTLASQGHISGEFPSSKSNYSLESVDRMASILHTLELAPEQTLEQVARQSGLNESTALRYLLSLSKYELVERNETSGRFRLGLSLFRLGSRSIEYRDIVTVSLPVMERLLAQFGESVNLATRQQEQVMLLKVLESANPTRKGATAGETDA
eukprot:gene61034-81374_t